MTSCIELFYLLPERLDFHITFKSLELTSSQTTKISHSQVSTVEHGYTKYKYLVWVPRNMIYMNQGKNIMMVEINIH
jgi:hypothetical protein